MWQSFEGLRFFLPMLLKPIRLILSQFLTPFGKKLLGEPQFAVGCALTSLGHSLAHVNILGRNTTKGPKYGFLKKLIWWVSISRAHTVVSGPKFTGLFCLMREELQSIS